MRAFRPCLALLLGGLLASGCNLLTSQSDERGPADGTITNQVYENAYFGLSLPLPEGWSVAPRETEEHLQNVGNKALAGDDGLLKAELEASAERTHQLLTLFEHPAGSPVPFNPNIIVMAEDVSHLPGLKSDADYLNLLEKTLERGAMPYSPLGEMYTEELGGRDFLARDFTLDLAGGILQSYIVTRDGDYVLGFILTAQDEKTLAGLVKSIAEVRFAGL